VAFEPGHPGVVRCLEGREHLAAELGAAEEREDAEALLGRGGHVVADPDRRLPAPLDKRSEALAGDDPATVVTADALDVGAPRGLVGPGRGGDLVAVLFPRAAQAGHIGPRRADETGGLGGVHDLAGTAPPVCQRAGAGLVDQGFYPFQLGVPHEHGAVPVDEWDQIRASPARSRITPGTSPGAGEDREDPLGRQPLTLASRVGHIGTGPAQDGGDIGDPVEGLAVGRVAGDCARAQFGHTSG
jgi:hypothetical protein